MKKILWILSSVLVLVSLSFLLYLYFVWKGEAKKSESIDKVVVQNMEEIERIIKDYYKWNYPYPKWDLILVDNNNEQIHLEWKRDLTTLKNLKFVQGSLCGLWLDNIQFQELRKWTSYSVWENVRCFSYSVTADKKNFQIWWVIPSKREAILLWNSKESITKDYLSNHIVENRSKKYLPYAPTVNSKIIFKKVNWEDADIVFESDLWEMTIWQEELLKIKWEWLSLPLWDIPIENLKISIDWNNYLYAIVYPNWNINYLWPNSEWLSEILIEEFKYDWVNSESTVVNSLWKIFYNLVSLSEESDYQIYWSNGSVITIRWTKFLLDLEKDFQCAYLSEWKINFKFQQNQYIVDWLNSLLWLKWWSDIISSINLAKEFYEITSWMYSISVAVDILTNSVFQFIDDFTISELEWNAIRLINTFNEEIEFVDWKVFSWGGENMMLYFSWYFDDNFAIKFMELRRNDKYKNWFVNNNVSDINDLINNVCRDNGYEKMIWLDEAYKLLRIDNINLSENIINFKLIDKFNWTIKKNSYILFDNETLSDTYITYFDGSDGQIKYKNISSFSKEIDVEWFWFMCK